MALPLLRRTDEALVVLPAAVDESERVFTLSLARQNG
jgi:hypothetical protein